MLFVVAALIGKSNDLLFINNYSRNLSFVALLLFRSGEVERNPGPKYPVIKFCHWNLNGLDTHNFLKVSLMEAFITTHSFHMTCLSETFLDSTVTQNRPEYNDQRLLISTNGSS